MADVPTRETFANMYAGKAPWDIGKPQPAFVDVADKVRGSVLDAGCGTGENALYFARRGCSVVGIDFLEFPIQEARHKAAARKIQAEFLRLDALTLTSFDHQFDSVIDSGLFHVFSDEDRPRYVSGLAHVAKTGARLFLQCFSDAEPAGFGPRRVSRQELETAFATGWTFESLQPARFEIVPEFTDSFSPGGPKAWFAVIQRKR
jgi:cyclopropane fatty-acyl-phospholipid synthase-like methyltransferase